MSLAKILQKTRKDTGLPRRSFKIIFLEYLRECGHIDDDWMMTNFLIITSQVNLKEDDISAVSWSASRGTPFWQQGGMIEYAKQRWERKCRDES